MLTFIGTFLTRVPAPVWAATIALFGVYITLRLTRITLFASLLERRIEWLKAYKKAVKKAAKRTPSILPDSQEKAVETKAQAKVRNLAADARWLFDKSVAANTARVRDQLGVIHGLYKKLASPNADAEDINSLIDTSMARLNDLVVDVSYSATPFLYVGDIKRPTKIVVVPKRITELIGKAVIAKHNQPGSLRKK